MVKNIFLVLSIQCLSGLFSAYAVDYNPRLLEMRAEPFYQRVWAQSDMSTSAKEIEEHLDFLNSTQSAETIKDFKTLRELCEQKMNLLRPSDMGNSAANNFKILIDACQDAYNRGDLGQKMAVSLLLQTVFTKSSPNIKRIERLLTKTETAQPVTSTTPKNLDYFLHADKSHSIISGVLNVH